MTRERGGGPRIICGALHNLGSEVMAPPGSDDRTLSCRSLLVPKAANVAMFYVAWSFAAIVAMYAQFEACQKRLFTK